MRLAFTLVCLLFVTAAGQRAKVYSYSTTAGEILGDGPRVTWNFENVRHGKHTATVNVRNQLGTEATASTSVDIVMC